MDTKKVDQQEPISTQMNKKPLSDSSKTDNGQKHSTVKQDEINIPKKSLQPLSEKVDPKMAEIENLKVDGKTFEEKISTKPEKILQTKKGSTIKENSIKTADKPKLLPLSQNRTDKIKLDGQKKITSKETNKTELDPNVAWTTELTKPKQDKKLASNVTGNPATSKLANEVKKITEITEKTEFIRLDENKEAPPNIKDKTITKLKDHKILSSKTTDDCKRLLSNITDKPKPKKVSHTSSNIIEPIKTEKEQKSISHAMKQEEHKKFLTNMKGSIETIKMANENKELSEIKRTQKLIKSTPDVIEICYSHHIDKQKHNLTTTQKTEGQKINVLSRKDKSEQIKVAGQKKILFNKKDKVKMPLKKEDKTKIPIEDTNQNSQLTLVKDTYMKQSNKKDKLVIANLEKQKESVSLDKENSQFKNVENNCNKLEITNLKDTKIVPAGKDEKIVQVENDSRLHSMMADKHDFVIQKTSLLSKEGKENEIYAKIPQESESNLILCTEDIERVTNLENFPRLDSHLKNQSKLVVIDNEQKLDLSSKDDSFKLQVVDVKLLHKDITNKQELMNIDGEEKNSFSIKGTTEVTCLEDSMRLTSMLKDQSQLNILDEKAQPENIKDNSYKIDVQNKNMQYEKQIDMLDMIEFRGQKQLDLKKEDKEKIIDKHSHAKDVTNNQEFNNSVEEKEIISLSENVVTNLQEINKLENRKIEHHKVLSENSQDYPKLSNITYIKQIGLNTNNDKQMSMNLENEIDSMKTLGQDIIHTNHVNNYSRKSNPIISEDKLEHNGQTNENITSIIDHFSTEVNTTVPTKEQKLIPLVSSNTIKDVQINRNNFYRKRSDTITPLKFEMSNNEQDNNSSESSINDNSKDSDSLQNSTSDNLPTLGKLGSIPVCPRPRAIFTNIKSMTKTPDKLIYLEEPVSIGRQKGSSISTFSNGVFDSAVMSRDHAQISYHDGKFFLEDMDSSNGTFVNDHMIPSCQLYQIYNEDIVQFGTLVITGAKTFRPIIIKLELILPLGIPAQKRPDEPNEHTKIKNELVEKIKNLEELLKEKSTQSWNLNITQDELIAKIESLKATLIELERMNHQQEKKTGRNKLQGKSKQLWKKSLQGVGKLIKGDSDPDLYKTETESESESIEIISVGHTGTLKSILKKRSSAEERKKICRIDSIPEIYEIENCLIQKMEEEKQAQENLLDQISTERKSKRRSWAIRNEEVNKQLNQTENQMPIVTQTKVGTKKMRNFAKIRKQNDPQDIRDTFSRISQSENYTLIPNIENSDELVGQSPSPEVENGPSYFQLKFKNIHEEVDSKNLNSFEEVDLKCSNANGGLSQKNDNITKEQGVKDSSYKIYSTEQDDVQVNLRQAQKGMDTNIVICSEDKTTDNIDNSVCSNIFLNEEMSMISQISNVSLAQKMPTENTNMVPNPSLTENVNRMSIALQTVKNNRMQTSSLIENANVIPSASLTKNSNMMLNALLIKNTDVMPNSPDTKNTNMLPNPSLSENTNVSGVVTNEGNNISDKFIVKLNKVSSPRDTSDNILDKDGMEPNDKNNIEDMPGMALFDKNSILDKPNDKNNVLDKSSMVLIEKNYTTDISGAVPNQKNNIQDKCSVVQSEENNILKETGVEPIVRNNILDKSDILPHEKNNVPDKFGVVPVEKKNITCKTDVLPVGKNNTIYKSDTVPNKKINVSDISGVVPIEKNDIEGKISVLPVDENKILDKSSLIPIQNNIPINVHELRKNIPHGEFLTDKSKVKEISELKVNDAANIQVYFLVAIIAILLAYIFFYSK